MQVALDRKNLAAIAAGAALTASMVSIAVSQILLAVAICFTFPDWRHARMPRITWLLAAFAAWTLFAAALSADPAAAWPQVRKFYVYLIVPMIAAAYTGIPFARSILTWLGIAGAASSLWSVVQYAKKYAAAKSAGIDFTQAYIADRVTGFMSHWMTFGGTILIVFLLASAYLLFARTNQRWRVSLALALLAVALLLSWARGVQLGALAGLVYLTWHWKRYVVLLIPVVVLLLILILPEPEKSRAMSVFRPRGDMDSNAHRIALWRTGLVMIQQNPVTGVGPEQVERNFLRYAPEDIPRPIPRAWWYGHLHNIYIQFAADRGIPGMLMIVGYFLGSAWILSRAAGNAPPESRWMLHGIAAVVTGTLITGGFEHNLADSEVLQLVLGTTSLGHCLARLPVPATLTQQ
jgi:O-antigen ligase